MLGFALGALKEVASRDGVALSVAAPSAYEPVGPDQFLKSFATPLVGAVAVDEVFVEAGKVVDGALEGGHINGGTQLC